MDLLFNDLSIHGQFSDAAAFHIAIDRLMEMRRLARRYGRDLQCHRAVANASVMHASTMPQAVQGLKRDKRSALMQWLARTGPFWDDFPRHDSNDCLECRGKPVTNTAVGEAAYRIFHDIKCGLVSMNPSSWLYSPLPVEWCEGESTRHISVPNYWDAESLAAALDTTIALASWKDLETTARNRFPDLTFSQNCFKPLHGHPFGAGAARALLSRLTVLQDIRNSSDDHGQLTAEGHKAIQKYFVGAKSWFSDSSDKEKSKFRRELTFPHPERTGQFLFCPWHGKVNTPKLRIHFTWPTSAASPLYVMYVGPKITKL